MKRLTAILLLAAFFTLPVYTLATAPPDVLPTTIEEVESYLSESLLGADYLRERVLDLRLAMGQSEQRGIFYTPQGLVKNLELLGGQSVHSANTREIIRFAENHQKPVYVMLIPTACAIKQQWVPQYAPLYNQKTFIEDAYRGFSGKVTVIDVYPTLFANRENYIFYNTDSNLTAYGGYLLYQAAAERMKLTPYDAAQFEQQYPVHDYYGDLYQIWPQRKVQGDVLTAYRFSDGAIGHIVSHPYAKPPATYRTLYPTFKADTASPYDVYLGGYSPKIEIETTGHGHSASLLVFGDRTAQSYLPFLTLHYDRITFADPARLSKEQLAQLQVQDYDQVLFAYSLESYLNSSAPKKVAEIPAATAQ